MSDEDLLKEAREAFEEAADREADNRAEALDDIRFSRLAEQWPDAIRKQREEEGRPCLTINKLPSFIRQVVNDARQNKPAIKVSPEDSVADPKTAEIMTGLIRNIERTSDADTAYDIALESAVTGGFGYFRLNLEYAGDDTFEQNICFQAVPNPFAVFGDPYSQRWDSADWNTAFVVDVVSKAEFRRRHKGAEEVDWEAEGYAGLSSPWFDEDEIQVAEYWTREEVVRQIVALSDGQVAGLDLYEKQKALFDAIGVQVVGSPRPVKSHKVMQRLLTGAEVLETVEWAGKFIPIVPVYGDEVNVEGKRHFKSLIRDAKDPQRMVNYWRTTATELVALAPKAPFIGPKGAFNTDAGKWATANSTTHAYIEYDGAIPPQRQPFAGVPAGALQEAVNASDDLKAIMGLYDASLGNRSNETSGRAIIARQREGDTSTFHFIDNLTRSIRHGGRILLDLIPKVYNTERIVRTLGEDGKPKNVPLKQPVIEGEDGAFAPAPSPEEMDPAQAAALEQQAQMARIFDLGLGRYDLAVTAGPGFTTRRQEAAAQMIDLIQAYPAAAPVIGDLLAKNLDWPGADEIAKRLEAQMSGANIDPAMVEQLHGQISELTQKLELAMADKSIEARRLQVEEFKAETGRMTAMVGKSGMAMTPEAVQALVFQTVQQLLTPGLDAGAQQFPPVQQDQGGFQGV